MGKPTAGPQSATAIAVIPARFASVRFPGKLLRQLHGRSILAHVCRRAAQIRGLDRILVATDDERIAEEATRCGVEVRMTSPLHASGSDRVGEVVSALDPPPGFVLNLQGDEPLLSPPAVERLLRALRESPDAIWTLADPIAERAEFLRPSVVKVVRGEDGRALYFSRAPVPYVREGWEGTLLRHVGVYGYPLELLRAFLAAAPSPLERSEGLEQLRALERGIPVRVLVGAWPDAGVDTPEDLDRLLARYPTPEALEESAER